MPDLELIELARIYQKRGLDKELSLNVARQLTVHNALEAHARDELGINEITEAKPLQAAFASFASFILGATLPFLISLFAPVEPIYFCISISAFIRHCYSKSWRFKCLESGS